MKFKLAIVSLIALPLAACQTSDQNAAAGALAGAAVGAAVSDNNRTEGALIGAALGVAASTLIGPHTTPGQCVYRDANGRRFVAAC